MKLISTSGNTIFKIIARGGIGGNVDLKLTSESTNVTLEFEDVVSARNGNYTDIAVDFGTLTEGDFYRLEVYTEFGSLIYLDRIFCTDQLINQSNKQQYSVNKNKYISEESSDNEFIII